MSVTYQVAAESYTFGYRQGEARRKNTRPTSNIPPRVLNTLWFDIGDVDGAMGRGMRDFRVDASQYVGDQTEKRNYELGYDGASQPLDDSARAWFEAGRQDRSAGIMKRYYLTGGASGPSGTRPAPRYEPKPNPNAANLPPVVVNPPTQGGGVNQPDVVMRTPQLPGPPVPPWQWPGGFGGGSGIVLYGPWGYLDISNLQPVGRR